LAAALLDLRRAAGTLLAELLLLTGQSLLALSALWATLATLLELLRLLARQTLLALLAALLRLLARQTLLALLAALLRLSLSTRLPAGLTFVLLALVLRVLALRDDEAAVGSARAVKRNAQLRDRNSRHQGAGEQDVAKLLQLPDGFEWQGPLLNCDEAHHRCAACRPDCGTSSAPLRPDFDSRLNGFQ
jgi:hypothetical protein